LHQLAIAKLLRQMIDKQITAFGSRYGASWEHQKRLVNYEIPGEKVLENIWFCGEYRMKKREKKQKEKRMRVPECPKIKAKFNDMSRKTEFNSKTRSMLVCICAKLYKTLMAFSTKNLFFLHNLLKSHQKHPFKKRNIHRNNRNKSKLLWLLTTV
jgi:hypothetical protein